MTNFYLDVIRKDTRFTSVQSIRDVNLLEPITRASVAAIIADAAVMEIKLIVTETYRSAERQALLFEKGATQLKTVGVHHYGLAADFAKMIDGAASWAGDWSFLRDLAGKYGLISGLDWGVPGVSHSFVDPDHVQRCSVAEQAGLFSGIWYPETEVPPAVIT